MADTKKYTGPSPPSNVKIDGKDETAEMTTKAMHAVTISAVIDDPTPGQQVKLRIWYSSNDFKTHKQLESGWGKQDRREFIQMPDLKRNALYKVRLWTVARRTGNDQVSRNFNGASFWTNRDPVVELVDPRENSEYDENDTILFDWKYTDPDDTDTVGQDAYQIRYRATWTNAFGDPAVGDWNYLPSDGNPQEGKGGHDSFRTYEATHLKANTTYLWSARARDKQGLWSDWPLAQSFFIRGVTSPPTLVSPTGGIGTTRVVRADSTIRFSWKFRDPDPTNTQTQADIRWRVVGTGDVGIGGDVGWVTLTGVGVTPGTTNQWDIPSGYFQPGFLYEWQARTYDFKRAIPSGWSESGKFVAAVDPGSANLDPLMPEQTDPLGELGCGHHRVFVYDRGGQVLRGEIKPLANVQWGRKRDDISNALVTTNGFDQDCCVLLGELQSWVHELVIFRDGVRVFEGPVTRITYTSDNVEVEAKDVMAYLYRRVMRQGYNDSYRRIDLNPKTPPKPAPSTKGGPYEIIGQNTVVERALQIALDALAYQNPNVLQYLTAITYPDDATESRVVADYSRTAWEEIDDLAATGGLDYTVVGRRIILWDTHRTIGRLPEMRDGDFTDPVIVTEYGMNTANWYAVTNNAGIAGIAYPANHNSTNWFERYGPVEMVSSAYGESQGATKDTASLTPAEKDAFVKNFTKQAKRGIGHRWPTPVVVRVPDNTGINPQVNLGINQLVPGVWIPLRATLTCRKLAQWQKLDSVDVEESEGVEQVRVTMSPAPYGGDDDPDLTGNVEDV